MNKAYTRTGNKGKTSILGPGRVWKDSLRVEAYGTVDELNTTIGLARAFIKDPEINKTLKHIQEDLFIVGADLATPHSTRESRGGIRIPRVDGKMIQSLEKEIDRYLKELKPVNGLIIPGGCLSSALLHFVRAVARRAERRAVTFTRREKVNDQIQAYLNRLSSLFFILARLANQKEGLQEDVWHHKRRISA